MLYETAARASEILALNVEDLDLEQRRATIQSACDEDSCRILSQLIRSGRSPVAGRRLVVR